jgi:hypothetical protein
MLTSARFIKDVNDDQKLWEMPDGHFILTSFSSKFSPKETAAFVADSNGIVRDWTECGLLLSEDPKHEEVIEDILGRYGTLFPF